MSLPLLLHICCAPCGAGCVGHPLLSDNGERRDLRLYYSNSNLNSRDEYDRRLRCVEQLALINKIELETDPYDHEAWLAAIAGLEDAPERGARCRECFQFSLRRTAMRAAELQMEFATTLTVSPHKSSKLIFEIASQWDNFVPLDFKKLNGYLTGTRLAREYGFYRQNYCGCEFSRH